MDTNDLLGIVGVLATVLIGYLTIIYGKRFAKNISLTFIKHEWIPLLKTIVKNLDDIEIKFKQKPISENIILFKGSFINNGNHDIDKAMAHKPLTIELPKGFKWLDVKIIKHSENVDVNCKISEDSKVSFNWDLLKKDEFFLFTSLVEFKKDDIQESNHNEEDLSVLFKIKFDHRITNLAKINEESYNLDNLEEKSNILFYLSLLLLAIGSLFLLIFAFSGWAESKSVYNVEYYLLKDNKKIKIEISAKSKDYILMKQSDTKEVHKVLPEELFKKFKIEPYIDFSIGQKIISYFFKGMFVLMGLIGLFAIPSSYREHKWNERLRCILNEKRE